MKVDLIKSQHLFSEIVGYYKQKMLAKNDTQCCIDASSKIVQTPSNEKNCENTASASAKWKLADFVIEHRLGHGRFGKVYLVREKATKCAFAMKKQLRNATAEIMVEREIAIQTDLHHRNILRLYGYIHGDEKIYLILEYAPNGNLRKKLDKQPEKRFDEKTAARYIRSCADAISYLHERDIIHRDIKPENLLLGYDDELKIADFGLSVNAQNQRRSTICGTPDYIPPESMEKHSICSNDVLTNLPILCLSQL